jgi:lipopolysaccharide export system protein LptC
VPSIETIFTATGERRDQVAAYKAATRHTKRVRFLRLALPVVILLCVAILMIGSWLDPLRLLGELPIEFARLAISGTKLKIEAPKLSGYTSDGRAYSVTAETAAQDLTQPGVIELTGIEARFEVVGGGTTTIRAGKGTYDSKAERLRLADAIDIASTNGFGGKLIEALLDMRKGHMLSTSPVDLRYQDGRVRADRLEIFDNGDRALFEGRVTAEFRLNPPAEATAEPKP